MYKGSCVRTVLAKDAVYKGSCVCTVLAGIGVCVQGSCIRIVVARVTLYKGSVFVLYYQRLLCTMSPVFVL